ncbi:hypothetical protein CU254_42705 (plasmid) [Amycolatopsis sp. AA4]|uniref:relaxase/mobilization nuclease domain-containing protein n=1 Tax=Actinomycetes TaxID=1760 RepID=UPI0001B57BC3|nr:MULTISPECIES: relaxase/mobilization nuclease domain-containing protein [Actinomycetes]ATY17297.1 hypothetical protein CU254_42705 [Amycolatopsis sp. AA4]EFL12722.1 predicted protein [Streptomyces sp. AA4]
MTGEPSTMVAHVAEGGRDMPGLMKYLYGPGKANEHRDQHMVAGSPGLALAWPGALAVDEARELGHFVESSWRAAYMEQMAEAGMPVRGVSRTARGSEPGVVDVFGNDVVGPEHVYHLIVSLPPDNAWTDEQWATVAQEFVSGMGFSDGPEDDQGCRWVAMRHGLSVNGNEHMHIAVNLVRQDGRWAELPHRTDRNGNRHRNDFALVQRVRREIEERHDFVTPLHDQGRSGRSLPAYTMAEHQMSRQRAEQTGKEVPDRVLVRQLVRAAAAMSTTEVEFINAVLDGAVGVELDVARWAPGGHDTVTGYKIRIGDGTWLSPTHFDPEMTLGKLRAQWEPNETAQTRAQALALWRGDAAPEDSTPVAEGDVEEQVRAAVVELDAWNGDLERLSSDSAEWRRHERDAAGFLSVFSRIDGPTGESFAVAADALIRHTVDAPPTLPAMPQPRGQDGAPAQQFGPTRAELAARHAATALRASSPDHHRGWLAVLAQVQRTVTAVHAASAARQELAAARALHTNAVAVLEHVTSDLQHTVPDRAAFTPEATDAASMARVATGRATTAPGATVAKASPIRPAGAAKPAPDERRGRTR